MLNSYDELVDYCYDMEYIAIYGNMIKSTNCYSGTDSLYWLAHQYPIDEDDDNWLNKVMGRPFTREERAKYVLDNFDIQEDKIDRVNSAFDAIGLDDNEVEYDTIIEVEEDRVLDKVKVEDKVEHLVIDMTEEEADAVMAELFP